ncbi:MAG: acyltransferase [Proteobacteria bacterium]|nr:MAG: acyltransferase [Pseudomonadota bacterium]
MISKQLERGSFSFTEFYVRRAHRLFPALIAMLSSVLLLGWLYLIDIEFEALGKHIMAAIFFVYNFVAKSESGYFSVDAVYKLVHHMWSLAVEEQFYLIYPIFLIAARRLKIDLWKAITFMIVVSFALNVSQFLRAPKNVFYQPEYRMWELALGGLISVRPPRLGKWLGIALASIAAVCIAIAFFMFSDKTPFPGYWAVVPALGTTLLISSASGTIVAKFFALRPLAWFGRISYPLYLWHWPLFSMACYFGYQTDTNVLLGLMALSVVLAGVTYELLEKPLKKQSARTVAIVSIVILLVLAGLGFLIFKGAIKTKQSALTSPVSLAMPPYDPPQTNQEFRGYGINVIPGRGALAEEKVLLLGDSVAYQYYPRFEKVIPTLSSSRSLYLLARGACPPIPGLHIPNDGYCGYTDLILDYVAQEKFSVILISAHWSAYLASDSRYRFNRSSSSPDSLNSSLASLSQLLENLKGFGAQVIVVQPSPKGKVLDPRTMIKRDFVGGLSVVAKDLPIATIMAEGGEGRKHLAAVSSKLNIQCLDPLKELCGTDACKSTSEAGLPLYKDDVHLNPGAASELSFLDFVLTEDVPKVEQRLRCD